MVAVQNYHGNPAPPGKPVLTFQTGDVIELLRGDPESQWWEVGPGDPEGVEAPWGRCTESCRPGGAGVGVKDRPGEREVGCWQDCGCLLAVIVVL